MDILFGRGGKAGNDTQRAAAAGGSGGLIKDGSAASFAKDVIEVSMTVPVIVDFWATWCGPCKTLGPALERLVTQAKGAVRMVKIDVDKNQELAAQLRIQSVPTVYAFKGGRPVDGFTGAVPDSQLKQFIERLLGGNAPGADIEEALKQAAELLTQGDGGTAVAIYQDILAEDPQHTGALSGLIRAAIVLGDVDGAKQVLDGLPPELARHADIGAARSALEVAVQAAAAGSPADLRKRLATDPADHQARFDLALAYYASGEREAAVDELLEIVRRDRTWNEDAARKQLVKFFEAFGPVDPLTISARRRLSSLLFA